MKKRYLLFMAIGAFALGVVQVSVNQAEVQNRIKAIMAKDEQGQDVTADMEALRDFVSSHMQTSANFTLKGSYSRAATAAQAATGGNSSGEIYAKAQASCGRRTDSVTQARCVSDYVARNSTPGTNPQPAAMPKPADFTKTFYGPQWTLDGSGISFLIGAAALAAMAYLVVL